MSVLSTLILESVNKVLAITGASNISKDELFDNLEKVYTEEKCPVAQRVLSLDHRMMPYTPCSLAGEVECNTTHPEHGRIGCGLYVPALFAAAKRGEPGAIRQLMEEAL